MRRLIAVLGSLAMLVGMMTGGALPARAASNVCFSQDPSAVCVDASGNYVVPTPAPTPTLTPTVLATYSPLPIPSATPVGTLMPVVWSDKFVQPWGFNADFTGPISGLNQAQLIPTIAAAGVRVIRAGAWDASGNYLNALNRLCALGIKHSFGLGVNFPDYQLQQGMQNQGGSNCVAFVEPQNEYDSHYGDQPNPGPGNFGIQQKLEPDHIRRALNTLGYTNIIAMGPSMVYGGDAINVGPTAADSSNWHFSPYLNYAPDLAASQYPFNVSLGDIGSYWSNVALTAPGKPVSITEMTYDENTTGQTTSYVSPYADAIYSTRQYLHTWSWLTNMGFGPKYLIFFEIGDIDSTGASQFSQQGFFQAPSGTPRVKWNAVSNLMALLADRSVSSFTPASIPGAALSITGNAASVKHVLLQNSSGQYFLVLWNAISSYDAINHVDIKNNAAVPVTFSMTPNSTSASLYSYNTTTFALNSSTVANANSFTVQVTDIPQVLSFHL